MTTAKMTNAQLAARIAVLEAFVADQSAKLLAVEEQVIKLSTQLAELPKEIGAQRKRGPKSENSMTDIIAWRIKYGDRSTFKVAENAEFFGLSRGQVYSLDKYTFQHVKENSFSEESPEYIKSVAEFDTAE